MYDDEANCFESLDGFEEALTVAFNDVDLCLRCVRAGYLVVYNRGVELYHYESKSRDRRTVKTKCAGSSRR